MQCSTEEREKKKKTKTSNQIERKMWNKNKPKGTSLTNIGSILISK